MISMHTPKAIGLWARVILGPSLSAGRMGARYGSAAGGATLRD